MTDFQPLEIDESAIGAVCSCMRCKAERYDSISKLNHHRAMVIKRMRTALEKISAMDPKGIRADDLGRAARIAVEALQGPVGGSVK